MADSDTDYYLKRAEQEEVLAIQADHPKAAAAHRGLSVRYSARAIIGIVNEQGPASCQRASQRSAQSGRN